MGKKLADERGQAIVEFALVLPVFILLLFGVIEFGLLFNAQLTLENNARECARYASIHAGESDLESKVQALVLPTAFTEEPQVDIEFSNPSRPKDGSVTATASCLYDAVTPIGHLLFGREGKDMSAAVTMKAEQ